jgi:hypothetical protein
MRYQAEFTNIRLAKSFLSSLGSLGIHYSNGLEVNCDRTGENAVVIMNLDPAVYNGLPKYLRKNLSPVTE